MEGRLAGIRYNYCCATVVVVGGFRDSAADLVSAECERGRTRAGTICSVDWERIQICYWKSCTVPLFDVHTARAHYAHLAVARVNKCPP